MKIVLAVDGSTHAGWAADLLMKLPLAREPRIEVVHVVDMTMIGRPLIPSLMAKEYREAIREETGRRLKMADRVVGQTVQAVRKRWKNVRSIVGKGRVADTIMARARENKADLIILGARGLSNIQQFLMGSVSQKVVTYAPCSVLVVKRKVPAIRTFLLAADGSKSSEKAMRFVKLNFLPEKLRGHALYVWEYPIYPHPESLPVQMIEERYCEPLARAGFHVRAHCLMGHAASTIVKVARREKTDLVIVGSRGLTHLKRLFLGGVSHKVVKYSHEPVLVVR